MLRGTRPLLTSPSRAIASGKVAVPLSLRRTPRTTPSHILPLIQKTRYATKLPSGIQQGIDPKDDKKFGAKKLESHPEDVSTESSVRHFYEPSARQEETPITEGIKADLETVKDTFRLSSVPTESYILGLAGTLPYLGTSISTVYLSWVLNTEWPSSSAFLNHFLIQHDAARQLLDHIEPIQLGYGAVIISFLGAIHWGLEYAEKTASKARTRFRYSLGVIAPVVAWPTLLMPVEFALTAQFGAFVALYFADSRASLRGWAPYWYGTYRFVLTAVVGAAIAISLIGRAKVGDAKPRLSGLNEKFHEHRSGEQEYTEEWEKREEEDRTKMKKEKEEAEKKKKEEEEKKAKEEEKKNKKNKKGDKGDKGDKNQKDDGGEKDQKEDDGGKKDGDGKEGGDEEKKEGGK